LTQVIPKEQMQLPPLAPTVEETNAEVLLWQCRYRATFVPLIGFAAVTLKWLGVISAESVYAGRLDERVLLGIVVGLLVAYLVYHRAVGLYLRRAKQASLGLVVSAIASDMLVLFVGIALMTPPEHYERALLLSIFTVQLTQVFFGWTATVVNVVLIGVGFTSLVAIASGAGRLTAPEEQLWTLAIFGIGMLVYVGLQGHVVARMRQLVTIFARAQDGDFSLRYEDDPQRMPDPVTVIGRAYNRMRDHLQRIVVTDALSGCYNRRGLNQLAEREVSRAVRLKKDLAVLAIDVDHFKRINDDYGHLTGDEVIREIGDLLRETSREVDVVARFGGEEFTILAPDSNDEGGLILADRVLHAFRAHAFRSLPPEVRVTVSIGVAAAPARDDEIAKTLFARADEALYVAKRNGRDRGVLWHAGMRAFDGTVGAHARASVPGMLRVTH